MESKKINQLATELTPALSDLTIIGDPSTGISKKITLSQMASLFTGTVEEYANLAAFPLVGAADTIYIALDTNVLYRWDTGLTSYVELSPNIINSLVFNDANGFDGTISLVGSVATLTITTALTQGSVGFIGASGALVQDNANFFWDDTNNRLGIGTNAPTTAIDVFGSGIIGRLNGTSTNNSFLGFASAGTNKWSIGNVQSDHRFRIYSEANTAELVSVLQTGEFGIGIANPTTKLHIDGGASALIANLDANVSVAKSISFRSDNSNRINLEVSGTESGSNAGANFFLRAYSDAGALLNTPLTITRSTGNATFINNIAIAGVSLSAWGSTFGIMQSYYGSYFGATSGGGTVMGNNNYFDGTNYKYVNSDYAGQIQIGSGNILFRVAASGTSGNNVTFTNALTIASTGAATFSNGATAAGVNSIIAKSGSGIESISLLNLRATGTGAIGDTLNIRFLNTDGIHIGNIAGIMGADNIAYGSMSFSIRNYNTDSLTECFRITNRNAINIKDGILSGAGGFEITSEAFFGARFQANAYRFMSGNNNTEFVRITSTGQTQVLCPTSSIAGLIVRNSASSVPAGQDILFTASPNNTTSAFLYCADGTEGKFVVWSNGDVDSRTNSYGGWSDIKLKENISDATPKLNDLLKVKVKNYNFIGDDKKQLGVIAQELEEIFPALISETPDYEINDETGEKEYLGTSTKSVKYSVFVPMLIKAIQEQQVQIEELKALIIK